MNNRYNGGNIPRSSSPGRRPNGYRDDRTPRRSPDRPRSPYPYDRREDSRYSDRRSSGRSRDYGRDYDRNYERDYERSYGSHPDADPYGWDSRYPEAPYAPYGSPYYPDPAAPDYGMDPYGAPGAYYNPYAVPPVFDEFDPYAFEDEFSQVDERPREKSRESQSFIPPEPAVKKPAPPIAPAAGAVFTEPDPSFDDVFEDDFEDDFDEARDDSDFAPPLPEPTRFAPVDEPTVKTDEHDFFSQSGSIHPTVDDEYSSAPQPRTVRREEPAVPRREATSLRLDVLSKILLGCVALICVLASLLISSGTVVEQHTSAVEQRTARFNLKQGFELMSDNMVNQVNGLPKVHILPMGEIPAPAPRADGFSSYVDEDGDTHDVYQDETISVDCSRKRYQVGEYSVIAAVARVKISHPTQLRSFFAGGEYSTSMRAKPSQMARQANAVVAINGELYNYAGRGNWLLIRNGTTYRVSKEHPNYRILLIDSNGDFKIMHTREAESSGLLDNPDNQIYHSINFGPELVMDGEVIHHNYNEYTLFGSRNPRSALGQVGPLEYVLVAVEGRSANSKGLSTDYVADLMYQLGCIQAYNVDGGQSSMMIFNGKLYNHVSNGGERSFGDIIYFSSALPEE